jgi:hypothetical protein
MIENPGHLDMVHAGRKSALDSLDKSMRRLQDQAYEMGRRFYAEDANRLATILANINNPKLSDAEFREFMRSFL